MSIKGSWILLGRVPTVKLGDFQSEPRIHVTFAHNRGNETYPPETWHISVTRPGEGRAILLFVRLASFFPRCKLIQFP